MGEKEVYSARVLLLGGRSKVDGMADFDAAQKHLSRAFHALDGKRGYLHVGAVETKRTVGK